MQTLCTLDLDWGGGLWLAKLEFRGCGARIARKMCGVDCGLCDVWAVKWCGVVWGVECGDGWSLGCGLSLITDAVFLVSLTLHISLDLPSHVSFGDLMKLLFLTALSISIHDHICPSAYHAQGSVLVLQWLAGATAYRVTPALPWMRAGRGVEEGQGGSAPSRSICLVSLTLIPTLHLCTMHTYLTYNHFTRFPNHH